MLDHPTSTSEVIPLKTKASIFGHAIHPMLVVIPLGALPTSLIFDILFVTTNDAAWFDAAFVATLVGLVGIAVAAVPGFMDYRANVPKDGNVHRTARTHMTLGVVLLLLFAVSAGYRWLALGATTMDQGWMAFGINVVGNIGLIAQGYLGGSLVEVHGISVHHGATRAREQPGGGRE